IPANATQVTLSLSLFIHSFASSWTNTGGNPSLDYRPNTTANQQVRVDIMNPNGQLLGTTSATGVLRNEFLSAPGDPVSRTITINDNNLTAFKGQTIRLRIAAVNNRGKLIVGVDNVKLTALFDDTANPTLTGLKLRNPGVLGTDDLLHTTDPT